MSLSKRQKALSAVFLIGVVALVADRTVLRPQGGPQAASANPRPVATAGIGPAAGPPAAPQTPPATVAQRLDKLVAGKDVGSEELRDPFSLPPSWSDIAGAKQQTPVDPTGGFAHRHQLKAVVVREGQSSALVDDTFLLVGQSLDGFTLVVIGPRSALFERDGRQVMLSVSDR